MLPCSRPVYSVLRDLKLSGPTPKIGLSAIMRSAAKNRHVRRVRAPARPARRRLRVEHRPQSVSRYRSAR